MAGYSGKANFDFEVERYKLKATGELFNGDNLPPNTEDDDYEYQLITLNVEGNSYFTPGRTYGLPENCFPDEGETEITSVVGPDGKDWSASLSDSENFSILEKIQEDSQKDFDEPDYDDYHDRDYEPSDAYDI